MAKAKRSYTFDRMDKETSKPKGETDLVGKFQDDLQQNQSYLNLILGALIVIVIGILLFNYFSKPSDSNLVPAQQTTSDASEPVSDVEKEKLPGKYTVKEGDTLFSIANRYYNDGYKYSEILKANKLASEDVIETGQVLDIPKIEDDTVKSLAEATPSPTPVAVATLAPSSTPAIQALKTQKEADSGEGGAENQTIWGEKISGSTYTVVEGDWLSKIAGRAYGDIMVFEKIAKANNITNPDVIEPGMVLKIPR